MTTAAQLLLTVFAFIGAGVTYEATRKRYRKTKRQVKRALGVRTTRYTAPSTTRRRPRYATRPQSRRSYR